MNTIIDVIAIVVIIACVASSAVVLGLWTHSVAVHRLRRAERALRDVRVDEFRLSQIRAAEVDIDDDDDDWFGEDDTIYEYGTYGDPSNWSDAEFERF